MDPKQIKINAELYWRCFIQDWAKAAECVKNGAKNDFVDDKVFDLEKAILSLGEENVGVLAYHPPTAGHHLQPQHPREPPRAVRRHRDLCCAKFEHLYICDLHLQLHKYIFTFVRSQGRCQGTPDTRHWAPGTETLGTNNYGFSVFVDISFLCISCSFSDFSNLFHPSLDTEGCCKSF